MSENKHAQTASEPEVTWKRFLTEIPPGRFYRIKDGKDYCSGFTFVLSNPVLDLFCESESCEKKCFFDCTEKEIIVQGDGKQVFIRYECRHCKKTTRIYALILLIDSTGKLKAAKLGELPPYGPHTPTKVSALIGEDRKFYFNGRRSEALGMGIGALIYYRRVVENQKNRIIGEIIKVCRLLSAGKAILDELEQAKNETRFSAAIEKMKAAFPQMLLINGNNPLALLHAALSQGVHDKSDEDCLQIAMSIRIILGELAERLSLALKDDTELTTAVGNLIKLKSGSALKGEQKLPAVVPAPAVNATGS